MKYAWVLSAVAGIALITLGMNLEGPSGALLMLVGMGVAFSTVGLFVLAEYKGTVETTANAQ